MQITEYWMKPGARGKSVVFFIPPITGTSDLPKGLIGQTANTFDDWDSGNGKATYYREGATAVVALDLVTKSIGTWVSGGCVLLSDTIMPGCYVLDIPNAALARGADWVIISLLENDDGEGGQVVLKINLVRSLSVGGAVQSAA